MRPRRESQREPSREPDFREQFERISRKLKGRITVWLVLVGLVVVLIYAAAGLVVVDKGKAAVLIRKTGEDLPSGQILALKEGQKGIQLKLLPEGWYWRNPYTWDWEIVEQIEIPEGKIGIRIRMHGEELEEDQVIAGEGQKGILPGALESGGRYMINPYAERVVLHDWVDVPKGYRGVVVRVSGKTPENPNVFLVDEGERGVQKTTVKEATYVPNPYIEKIIPVDTRAHRFDMMGDTIIQFPSLDGFEITMEGTIEWRIDKNRVPEVYVKYVDRRDVITCIVEKIILPNARAYSRLEGSKHLARDFIEGETRQKFQEEFLKGLKEACARQGIVVDAALVRKTTPPDAIAVLIRDRQIAERNRAKYIQQMEREKQEKLLKMEEEMKKRMTEMKQEEAEVAVNITGAKKEKEVAVIDANRQLRVAELRLEAAKNEASAILAEGQAKADVIVYNNTAEAEGLRNSVVAFKNPNTFVRYLLNKKLGPAFSYILSNTDDPFSDIFRRAIDGTDGDRKNENEQND